MSSSLPHVTLTTRTSSLSPISSNSPIFLSLTSTYKIYGTRSNIYPAMFDGRVADQHQIPSLTSYEPKLIETKSIEPEAIEPEDLGPRKIELDRNLGTDPYQIHERFYEK